MHTSSPFERFATCVQLLTTTTPPRTWSPACQHTGQLEWQLAHPRRCCPARLAEPFFSLSCPLRACWGWCFVAAGRTITECHDEECGTSTNKSAIHPYLAADWPAGVPASSAAARPSACSVMWRFAAQTTQLVDIVWGKAPGSQFTPCTVYMHTLAAPVHVALLATHKQRNGHCTALRRDTHCSLRVP
jgi:hypothetical protein